MISRFWLQFIKAILLAGILNACSKEDGTKIYGHWRAERIQLQSIQLPIGPDFVVSQESLMSINGEVSIPISSISAKDNVVVLDIPMGLGLSFYFVDPDRMYFDVPFVGLVYYSRVKEPARAVDVKSVDPIAPARIPVASAQLLQTPVSSPKETPQSAVKSAATTTDSVGVGLADLLHDAEVKIARGDLDEAELILRQAGQQFESYPLVDFNFAILRMHQKDQDMAIRHLSDAFRHGFRAYGLLENSSDLAPLKADSRYTALLARYR